MDGFKTAVIVTLLVSTVAIGFMAYVIGDVLENAEIPDQQYGTVSAKNPVADKHPAIYVITLQDGKHLYITTNTTTYYTIEIGKSYLFSCRIDVKNNMVIIDSALQTNRTET